MPYVTPIQPIQVFTRDPGPLWPFIYPRMSPTYAKMLRVLGDTGNRQHDISRVDLT